MSWWEEWQPVIILVIFVVVLCVAIYGLESYSCIAKTVDIGFAHRFSVMGGCQINVDHRWIPLDNWYFKTQ